MIETTWKDDDKYDDDDDKAIFQVYCFSSI